MTILYSCKSVTSDGGNFRITKWDDNEPITTYLCTTTECDCPAGSRSTCRHREMLPRFIDRGAVNTGWHWDHDRGGWVDNRDMVGEDPGLGFTVMSLDDPIALHNAIAEAVGEPEARLSSSSDTNHRPDTNHQPLPAKPKPWRRF
jgi:hypothetical protein